MTNIILYEFYSGKKPTDKLRKAIDKILRDKLINQLAELGIKRITITNLRKLRMMVKNKESII